MKLFFGAFATPTPQDLGLPPSSASLQRLVQHTLRGQSTPDEVSSSGVPVEAALTQIDLIPGVPEPALTIANPVSGERARPARRRGRKRPS
jgi:hypothetical protein